MIRFLIGLCLIFVVLPARAEDGPSFDCGKASTEIERMICALPRLAAADRELNDAYTSSLAKLPPSGQEILRESQRDWLKALEAMCLNRVFPQSSPEGYNAQCLSLQYRKQAEYFYQTAIIELPGGEILIRRQRLSANADTDYNRDPVTGACLGQDYCLALLTAYTPAFVSSRLAAALPAEDFIDKTAGDPGEANADFEIIAVNTRFLTIRQRFGWNSPLIAHGSNGEFTYTIDLRLGRRLMLDDMFKPDTVWQDYLVEEAVKAMPLEESEACAGRPNRTPREWYTEILSEYGWFLTETDLVIVYYNDQVRPMWPAPCSVSLPLKSLKKFMMPDTLALIDWSQNQ